MEKRLTAPVTGHKDEKIRHQVLRILHALFVAVCFFFAIATCIIFFNDGHDGLSILLKLLAIPLLLFLAWMVANTPRWIGRYLASAEGYDTRRSKALLVAGIFFSGMVGILIVAGIFPVEEKNDFSILAPAPAGSPQFVQTLASLTNVPVEHGGPVTLIENGATFLPILQAALGSASSSIDFTTYPWSDSAFSDRVFDSLIKAAGRGVQVRVLLDAFGAHNLSGDNVRKLQAAGGKVALYHPFNLLDPLQYNSRDHIRSIVIDGKTGFTGGMGITADWLGNPPNQIYQDMMFECEGAMAQSLQRSFGMLWTETTGEILSGPAFYPPLLSSPASLLLSPLPGALAENTFVGITSIPSNSLEPVRDTFLLTALSAQKKLFIAISYIIPDDDLLEALEAKARAGVDVRIVSPGESTIAPILRAAWHKDYERLLEAGVKLYEYEPSMIHTKFIVADDAWSVIGSANMDNRSEAIDDENMLGIADPKLAEGLDRAFAGYQADSKQITLGSWKSQYGFFESLYSRLLLILEKQY